MYEGFKGFVVRLLKVPPEPEPPAGEHLEVFRAAKAWFAYRRLVWLLGTVMLGLPFAALTTGAAYTAAIDVGSAGSIIFMGLAIFSAASYLLVAAGRYATLRLDYEMRWYMVTDRSLRIREGVVGLREMTLTFANIQEISISQGPIQRYFGVQDVLVRTAGGGAATPHNKQGTFHMHVGYFRGVDNAEAIRDLIRARLDAYKDAGLGDLDDTNSGPRTATLVDALTELRNETSALKDAV